MKAQDLIGGPVLDGAEKQGILTIKGNRFLLIDADAMGLLRRELIAVLGLDMARRLLVRYGYACGYSDALRLKDEYQWDTDEEWLMAGPMMHMLEGIVAVRNTRLTYSRQDDRFLMEGEWHNSYEAEQHQKHLGLHNQAVCWTLSGYASGYGTAFFGRQVVCVERKCLGRGDTHCEWSMQRPQHMGPEAQQYLADLQGFDLAGTIDMLEEQIAARTVELSALNAVSIVLGEFLALDELLDRVLPHVLRATGSLFGRIFLLDEDSNKLELRVQTEPDMASTGLDPISLNVSIPVSQQHGWSRLQAGNLVISHEMTGNMLIPELSSRHKWRSLVSVPLMVRGSVIGVMELASANQHWPASPEEKRLLLSLGRQIGMGLGNARLYEQEQQQARAWRSLVEISHKVAGSQDRQQALEALVQNVRELLDGSISFVALLSEEEQNLEVVAVCGCRHSNLKKARLPLASGLCHSILITGQPLLVLNYATDPRLKVQPIPEVNAEGIISLIAVPLTARSKVLGVLYLGERRSRQFTEADTELLQALATQAAISVDTSRLHEREIARVKEVERLKADFLAMVTHELRTPLTNIKGMSSSLLQNDISWAEEDRKTFLEAINEEADVLTGLVSDLLDMSRLEAGAWTIHLEECTLEEIIRDIRRKLAGILQQPKIDIRLEPDLPPLRVDPNQIGRVLVNLLVNAQKYGQAGQIILQARRFGEGWVEVSVSDMGPGIPADARPHVFDKFYRGRNMYGEGISLAGAGLGLAIVKGIVEAHGGKVWLAEPGDPRYPAVSGATFCLTLPVYAE